MLIWKLSAGMVIEKPLTGYGYGRFEYDYNLNQANYFSEGNATASEIKNSAYVRMAYNEYLQNAVEGGLVALLIISALFLSLLIRFPSGTRIDIISAYGGIAAFVCMSFSISQYRQFLLWHYLFSTAPLYV